MKKIFKRHKLPLLIIVVSLTIGLAPIASLLLASFIAEIGNCTLNEGNIHPCKIGTFELGGLLYQMSVAGWFMFLSLPVGLVGLAWGITSLKEQITKNANRLIGSDCGLD
jgi:hypothetical protein